MLTGRMKKIRESLGGAAVLRKVRALHGEIEAAERVALAGEIDKVRDVLTAIAREVSGGAPLRARDSNPRRPHHGNPRNEGERPLPAVTVRSHFIGLTLLGVT